MASPVRLPFRPYIIVFGDDLDQTVTKILWSHLAGQDVTVVNPRRPEQLEEQAPGAIMIFVILKDESDPLAGLAQALEHPEITCHVTALVRDTTLEQRMNILSNGFDSIFNLGFIEDQTFRKILLHHVEKGRIRLSNRISHDEYSRIRAALSFSTSAIIILDEEKKLFFVSDHYLNAYPSWGGKLRTGMTVEEGFNLFCREEGFTPDDQRYEGLRNFWMNLDGEYDFHDDRGRILRMMARPLGEGQGTIVLVTNLTPLVQQQGELERQSAELAKALAKEREASAIQKQFISMVSHEFRTPLTVIDGHAQIIERRGASLDAANLQRRGHTIRNAVSRLILMMEGVLSSNMLQTGKLTLSPESFDIHRVINDLCDEHADLTADCRIETDLSQLPEKVALDRKIFMLIMSNLLTNAVKFSGQGPRINVAARVENGRLAVSVADQGMGIPENEIVRVFERYYRATTAGSVAGTGLGLSLVKDLIQLQGGTIAIESREGAGTTVTFSLPLPAERR